MLSLRKPQRTFDHEGQHVFVGLLPAYNWANYRGMLC